MKGLLRRSTLFVALALSACHQEAEPSTSTDATVEAVSSKSRGRPKTDLALATTTADMASTDLATSATADLSAPADLAQPTTAPTTTTAPTATGVAPASGPVGTVIEVTGSGFQTGDTVQISSSTLAATTLVTLSLTSTAIYATVPSVGVPMPADVQVRVVRSGATSAALPYRITAGRSFFLSPTGSDSAAGSYSAPWKTISAASSKMAAGDVAYLRGGTYASSVVISASGTASAPLTFAAYPGEVPLIQGPATAPGSDVDAIVVNGSYVVLDGMRMTNLNNPGQVVFINFQATHVTVSNSEIFGSYGQGVLIGGSYNTIYRCNIHDNGSVAPRDHGIYVEGGYNVIRSNLIHDNFTYGLQLFNGYVSGAVVAGYGYTTVEYNYIYGNGFKSTAALPSAAAGGFVIANTGAYTTARYNRICGNAQYGIQVLDQEPGNQITDNVTCYNKTGGINMQYPGAGNGVLRNISYNDSVYSLSSLSGVASDYNTYWQTSGSPVLRWNGSSMSLAQFQSASGQDLHSAVKDPAFTNVPTTGFTSSAASTYNFCTTLNSTLCNPVP